MPGILCLICPLYFVLIDIYIYLRNPCTSMVTTGIFIVFTSFTKDMINMSTYLLAIGFIHSANAHTYFRINKMVYIVMKHSNIYPKNYLECMLKCTTI